MNPEFYYEINDFISTAERTSNEILGFHCDIVAVFTFLGCYVAYIDSRLPTFRDSVFTFEGSTVTER